MVLPSDERHLPLAKAITTSRLRDWLKIAAVRVGVLAVLGPLLWVTSPNWCTTGNTYLGVTCWEARAWFSASLGYNVLLVLVAAGLAGNAAYVFAKYGGRYYNGFKQPN